MVLDVHADVKGPSVLAAVVRVRRGADVYAGGVRAIQGFRRRGRGDCAECLVAIVDVLLDLARVRRVEALGLEEGED